MKIWFDIDDVLCDTASYICKKNNNKINGRSFSYEDWSEYVLSDIEYLGFENYEDSEKYYSDLFLGEWDLEVPTIKNAEEVIKSLKTAWHKIYLITSRPLDYELHTKLWLDKNFWPGIFEEIHFIARENTTKWRLCEDLCLDLYIEDYSWYAEEVAKNWIKVLLLDTPYNRNVKYLWRNIERIYDLSEIFDKIK